MKNVKLLSSKHFYNYLSESEIWKNNFKTTGWIRHLEVNSMKSMRVHVQAIQ